MSEKKYLICPGHVFSQKDGDRHYINADMLIKLYGVDRNDCIIKQIDMPTKCYVGLIPLRPDYFGDYKLPKKESTDE